MQLSHCPLKSNAVRDRRRHNNGHMRLFLALYSNVMPFLRLRNVTEVTSRNLSGVLV